MEMAVDFNTEVKIQRLPTCTTSPLQRCLNREYWLEIYYHLKVCTLPMTANWIFNHITDEKFMELLRMGGMKLVKLCSVAVPHSDSTCSRLPGGTWRSRSTLWYSGTWSGRCPFGDGAYLSVQLLTWHALDAPDVVFLPYLTGISLVLTKERLLY